MLAERQEKSLVTGHKCESSLQSTTPEKMLEQYTCFWNCTVETHLSRAKHPSTSTMDNRVVKGSQSKL